MKLARFSILAALLAVGGFTFTLADEAPVQFEDDGQDEGIVRISDCDTGSHAAMPADAGCLNGACQSGQMIGGGICSDGSYGGCGNGACGRAGCGLFGGGCGSECGCGCGTGCGNGCGAGGLCGGHGCRLFTGFHWQPPCKHPIHRMAVTYQRYYPSAWTGVPGDPRGLQRNPVVYMPTDTTQLGYYYQQVPWWTPRAGMIPGVPRPASWHGVCPDPYGYGGAACGVCNTGYVTDMSSGMVMDGSYCTDGSAIGNGQVIESSPTYTPGPAMQQPLEAAPIQQPAVPPAPAPQASLNKAPVSGPAPKIMPAPPSSRIPSPAAQVPSLKPVPRS